MNGLTRYITRGAGLLTIIMGCLVLAGWFFDIPSFKSVLPGIISMKFNTALCFILSGIALYLQDAPAVSRRRKKIAFICAGIILIAGFLNLLEYIFNWNIGIDEFLWKEGPGTAATTFPGRMSLNTSVNFALLGFIFLTLNKRKYHWIIQALLFAMPPFSLLTIFNHLFGFSFLNNFPLLVTTALHTAILFIVLCLGVSYSSPLQYIRYSFKKKIAGFFVLVLFVLGIISFAFQKNKEKFANTDLLVEHTHEVLFVAEQVGTQANEIQSGVRGYTITGEVKYLPLFINSANTIDNIINRLRVLTKDNLIQQKRLDSLKSLIDTYITSRKELINIRRDKGFDAAQKKFLDGNGKLMIDKVRSMVAAIEQEENQLLAKRKTENKQNIQNSSRITLLFQIIIVLLLLLALLVIYNNTRARDKAEEQLKESEEKYSKLFNSIDEGFCIIEMIFDDRKKPVDYRFLVINTSFERQTGLRDAVGKRMREFAPDHEEHWFETYGRIALTGESIRFENRAEQLHRWYDGYAFRFGEPKNLQVAILFNDITGRKQAEDTIRQLNLELEKRVDEKTKQVIEKEQQYRFLLQNMREGIQLIGFDWKYVFVNNSVVKQSKYSNEELLGHTMMEKYPGIEKTELFKVLQLCMEECSPQLIENEFTFPDGTKEWYELSIQPVPEGVFILSMDITERKKAEEKLKRYAEELKNSNTELERFAYVASHDLQEPLRMVSSFLNLLEEEFAEDLNETAREYIHFAVDGARRMKILVNDLLQYSRVGANKEEFTATDLNETMDYVTRVLDEDIKKNQAVITVKILPVITANKTLINQLFINLVSNALKYHGENKPEIEIGFTEDQYKYVFYVKDNGIGIDPKFFDKIFIIFQRLHNKGEYSGTGIGLAICNKIVETHKGKIWVESKEGKGSTFYFSIAKYNT